MKKKFSVKKIIIICLFLLIILIVVLLNSCNYDLIDTQYKYDYAIVEFPGGEVKTIQISKWKDYEGEQIHIEAKDGTVYLVSSFNCVLVESD